jgi:hypothetical protein
MKDTIRQDKKLIAWGVSPLLEIYIRNSKEHQISYCIDSAPEKQGQTIEDVSIFSPDILNQEDAENIFIIICAMSSSGIQAIHSLLSNKEYKMGKHYTDLADFLSEDFKLKADTIFQKEFSYENYIFARSFNFNSNLPLETSILGNWLIIEAITATRHLTGAIAEVGAYHCGNAFLQLSQMTLTRDSRKYYIFDSFKGFPELSENDPIHLQNAYANDYQENQIFNLLEIYDKAIVCPGYVPQTFKDIPNSQKFSVVFYDCDLYQPALDTYEFFWERIEKGGMLIIHDNIATSNGWKGVRKATKQFFGPKNIKFHDFWETTMSVVFKP